MITFIIDQIILSLACFFQSSSLALVSSFEFFAYYSCPYYFIIRSEFFIFLSLILLFLPFSMHCFKMLLDERYFSVLEQQVSLVSAVFHMDNLAAPEYIMVLF